MIKRLLIINPFGIGDSVITQLLIRAIKTKNPDIQIGFLCNERTHELIQINEDIQKIIIFNRDHLRGLRKSSILKYAKYYQGIVQEIKEGGYDACLDYSLGREFGLLALMAGIKVRIGFNFKGRGLFLTKSTQLESYDKQSIYSLQASLLKFLAIDLSETSPLKFKIGDVTHLEYLDFRRTTENHEYYAVACGGGKTWGQNAHYKQWDAIKFAQTIIKYQKQSNLIPILIGDDTDLESMKLIKEAVGLDIPIVHSKSLPLVSLLLKEAKFLLCNDGGLMHLANAQGTPVVAIFGPVDPKSYGPTIKNNKTIVVQQEVPCQPCYKQFRFPPCQYNRRCLSELSTEKVFSAIEKMV